MKTPPALSLALEGDRPVPLSLALSCAAGEMLALVGPSGAGKSTLLSAIAGLHRVRSGHIAFGSHVVYDSAARIDLAPHRRKVGFVFQSFALFPHMTALENVMTAMGQVARSERRSRALHLLAIMHLEAERDRRPHSLSGGERQRVALARALAREPEILLLDEPFSAVDRLTRRSLYRELRALRRHLNIPTLLVTHDIEEATLLADRMLVIDRGRICDDGPPEHVLARPASAKVARLLDLGNIVCGIVRGRDPGSGRLAIDWAGGRLEAESAVDLPPGSPVELLLAKGRLSPVPAGAPGSFSCRLLDIRAGVSSLELSLHPLSAPDILIEVRLKLSDRTALPGTDGVLDLAIAPQDVHLLPS